MDLLYSRQHRALLVIVLLGIAIVVAVAPYASDCSVPRSCT
jgi:hypothetical protein